MLESGIEIQKAYDAIVVGSGASGSWAAKELAESGLEVLVLEAGRKIQVPVDYGKMENSTRRPTSNIWKKALSRSQHIQARCGNWSPLTKHFYVNDHQHPYTSSKDSKFHWFRGRQTGGRLHTWARVSPRMSDNDFHAASLDGYGRDWPITYRDLEPYYDKVESFMGLYGNTDGVGQIPDGVYSRPWPLTSQESAFKDCVENIWPERRVIGARVMQQRSRVPITLLAAMKTGRCEIRTNAIVKRIEMSVGQKKAKGVVFMDSHSKIHFFVRSRVVILCASAIESIRILLNSKCSQHPNGLGNNSGQLGRGVMDNTLIYRAGHTTSCDQPPYNNDVYSFGKGSGFFIPQYCNISKLDNKFRRGYYICGAIGRGSRTWWMICFGAMLPYPDNRVTLHPKKTDAWGIPTVHIDVQYRQNELTMITDQIKSLEEMTEAAGLCNDNRGKGMAHKIISSMVTHRSGSLYPGFAVHECGGAPMGTDSAHAVLNPFNQCFDVENVFVADGACFPSSTAVNPTNTIMALTVRTCEHIAYRINGGGL